MSKELSKETIDKELRIKSLEERVQDLEGRLNKLELQQKDELDPMRLLEIKTIAREFAQGNKGPLKEWNRRHDSRRKT